MRKPVAWYDEEQKLVCIGIPDDGASRETASGRGRMFDANPDRNEWLTVDCPDGRQVVIHGVAMESTGKAKGKRSTQGALLEQLVAQNAQLLAALSKRK